MDISDIEQLKSGVKISCNDEVQTVLLFQLWRLARESLKSGVRIAMSKTKATLALTDRVQAVAGNLTTTKHKLISYLLKATRDVAIGTFSEFATRLGVHEATTSRLARKLGFSSYAEFRYKLRREFWKVADPA
jgi:hypothetical protein